MNRFSKYSEPTLELVLQLLADAYGEEAKLDKILNAISEELLWELQKELKKMVKDGKIDLDKKISLHNHPALYAELKKIEDKQWQRLLDYWWIGCQVITESMRHSYSKTLIDTYSMFGYAQLDKTIQMKGAMPMNVAIQVTDTYITEHALKIPWCQDGRIYSDRLYSNVAHFQQKLSYVLEEGITNGRGMEWMIEAWRKLTGSAAYDAARLLKTETMAMWSSATKTAYLEMGIEYVEIVGDAECGGICLDYLGGPIPLAEAELGDLLPPYHPNCACSYIAWEETTEVPVEEEIFIEED